MGFSNFYLTDQGATLLAKLQATKANINYTKAAIGKGDLPSGVNIVTVMALVDQVKTVTIASVTSAAQQAQITLQMTNSDISADFKWKEVGVWAMDPDEGEILYIYGNAGEDADTIPAYSSGLNEFLFTIIAKIANGTSAKAAFDKGIIYITQGERGVPGGVANQDDLTTHTFNQAIHITALTCKKSGTNFALAGTLPGTGIIPCQFIADVAYNSGDTFTVNETNYGVVPDNGGSMWPNTFPAGAVVSAKLDIANTKIHLNAMLTAAQVGASNPNLLINPCGNINQRGASSYSTPNAYTLDRWIYYIDHGSFINSISQGSSWGANIGERYIHMSISSFTSSGYDLLAQIIEDNANGLSPLSGRTVTFSALVNTTGDYRLIGIYYYDSSNVPHCAGFTNISKGVISRFSVTAAIPANSHRVYVAMSCSRNLTSADVGTYCDFTEAKLEIGSAATPFSPRPYAEELAMCQRYFQKDLMICKCFYNANSLGVGFTFPVPMRSDSVPSMVYIMSPDGIINRIDHVGFGDIPINALPTFNYLTNESVYGLVDSAGQFVVGDSYGFFIAFDNEIY